MMVKQTRIALEDENIQQHRDGQTEARAHHDIVSEMYVLVEV